MNILLLHPKNDVREMLAFPLEGKLSAVTMGASNEAESRTVLLERKFIPDYIVAENSPDILDLLGRLLKDVPLKFKLILCDAVKMDSPPLIPGADFLGF